MPDIWMDVDTAVTIPVNKVPIVASSDGFTTDETIAWNESGMDLNWNFVTAAGVQTQTNVSPTTAGEYDWTHVGNAMYKIEMTASGGASADNDTEGFGWFSGKADDICPFSGPTIGFRAAAINDALFDTGDTLDVNVTAMTAGVIANATFAADVGSTVHGDNIIALAVRKILEELNLDHLLKITTGVAADGELEPYVVAGTVLAHVMAAGADATAFKASTDSLEAIKVHADSIKSETVLIVEDTNEIQGKLPGGNICDNSTPLTAGETESEVNDALVALDLDHLINASVADEVADDSIIAKLVSKNATANWSDYVWQDESLEALKDGILADIVLDTGTTIPATITTAQDDLNIITGTSGVVIEDGTITEAKLGADCITNAKIADDAIAAENLATGAIAADAVDSTALDNIVMSDLPQGAPSATAGIVTAINVLYEAFRNKTETTATLITIMKDDGTTDLMKSTISDAGGTTTKEEFVSG